MLVGAREVEVFEGTGVRVRLAWVTAVDAERRTVEVVDTDCPGEWQSEKAQRHLRAAFDRLGITLREHTDIAGVEPTGAVTADGRTIPAEEPFTTTA